MPTQSELEAAYRATTYRVFLPGGVRELRIGTRDDRLVAWLAGEGAADWAVLTACNPASVRLGEEENRLRQAALEVALLEMGLEPYTAENVADDAGWTVEESCFVTGLPADAALGLAARFGQNALVCGAAEGMPRLLWVTPAVDGEESEGR